MVMMMMMMMMLMGLLWKAASADGVDVSEERGRWARQ